MRSYGGWESVKLLRRENEVRLGDERILGDSDFVEAVLKINKQTHWQNKGWDLERLVIRVCDYCGIEPIELLQKGRRTRSRLLKV